MSKARILGAVLALVLASLVTAVPQRAVAASSYDNAYQTTDRLLVGGTTDGTPICPSEDVTSNWRDIIADSPSAASFADAVDAGSYSVTQNYTYNNSNNWQKIVDVFWSEDESLQISFAYMGWGGHYSVNVSASAQNKLHYGQIKANWENVSGLADCELYFYEFSNSVYNFQNSSVSWDLASGAPSLHNFFMDGVSVTYPSGYDGLSVRGTQPSAKYVAMGDSYSSGEGNERFEYKTDVGGTNENRCHRSIKAYPRLLANDSSLNLGSMKSVACSGATTASVINGNSGEGNWDEGPQIDALSADTEVVTITIGGNDVGFKSYAEACVYAVCNPGSVPYSNIMEEISSSNFASDLKSVYEEILSEAPNADLYVADYPYLTADGAAICGIVDFAGARDVQVMLNNAILRAVYTVGLTNNRIHYVDTNAPGSPFNGKHYCNGGATDFNGVVIPAVYSFHPNESGQGHYKDVFADAMS